MLTIINNLHKLHLGDSKKNNKITEIHSGLVTGSNLTVKVNDHKGFSMSLATGALFDMPYVACGLQ